MITYLCPTCRGRIDVEDSFANSLITCRHCEAISEAPTRTREVVARRDPPLIQIPKRLPTAPTHDSATAGAQRLALLWHLRRQSAYRGTRMTVGGLLIIGLMAGAVFMAPSPEGLVILVVLAPGSLVSWLVLRLLCDLGDIHLAALQRATEHYERVEKRSDGSSG